MSKNDAAKAAEDQAKAEKAKAEQEKAKAEQEKAAAAAAKQRYGATRSKAGLDDISPVYQFLFAKIAIRNIYVRQFMSELLGTYTMILFITGAHCGFELELSKEPDPNGPEIFGAAMTIAVGATAGVQVAFRISGGQLNPGFSFALATDGHLPFFKVPIYIAGQVIGGFLAAMTNYMCFRHSIHYMLTEVKDNNEAGVYSLLTTIPKQPYAEYMGFWDIALDQSMATMVMIIGVMTIIDHPGLNQPIFILVLNVTWVIHVAAAGFSLQTTNGMNFARDFMPRLFMYLAGYRGVFAVGGGWFWLASAVVGNFVGSLLGVHLYELHVGIHRPKPGDENERHTITCPECLNNMCDCYQYSDNPAYPPLKSDLKMQEQQLKNAQQQQQQQSKKVN